jgi:hypothetical protein
VKFSGSARGYCKKMLQVKGVFLCSAQQKYSYFLMVPVYLQKKAGLWIRPATRTKI